MNRCFLSIAFCFAIALPSVSSRTYGQQESANSTVAQESEGKKKGDSEKWQPLLKSDSLEGWHATNFGGEGTVDIKQGVLRFGLGDPLTGITLDRKDFPTENFEIRWKATRVEGTDFFAGVTFPVGKEYCSFICGGWGGGLVGLSSINGNDASENETASFRQFKNGKVYSFKIRVDKTHITAWIDNEEVVQVERANRKFSLRAEVLKSRPLGYCVFQSLVDVTDFEYQVIE
jgi:hypothetical protein